MRLKNYVSMITGVSSGSGIGRAIARLFAMEGSSLVLSSYRQDEAAMRALAGELEEYGSRVLLFDGDLSSEETVRKLVAAAEMQFGKVDVLVNSIGISQQLPLSQLTLADWERMLSVDLTAVFLTCREVLPLMLRQNFGRIINVASQIGQKGAVECCHYAAAKAGVIGFTKSLAREVGGSGITANCIAPGPIITEMLANTPPEWVKNKKAELVIPRIGEAFEVAPTAVFLASAPDGNLYTGQTLGPNCGDVML